MDALGPIRPSDSRGERPAPRARVPAPADPAHPAELKPAAVARPGPSAPAETGSEAGPSRTSPAVPKGFDDAEVARILARAAELDALGPSNPRLPSPAAHRLLSLSDLEAVAIEAGIDPHHVRIAASEVALRRSESAAGSVPIKTVMGLPERVDGERVVAAEVDDATWGRMVQELREHAGSPGTVTTFGAVREWHSTSMGGANTVTVRLEPLATGLLQLSASRNTSAHGNTAVALAATFITIVVLFAILFLLVPPADGLARLPAVVGVFGGLGAAATGASLWSGRRALDRARENQEALLDRLELLALRSGEGQE